MFCYCFLIKFSYLVQHPARRNRQDRKPGARLPSSGSRLEVGYRRLHVTIERFRSASAMLLALTAVSHRLQVCVAILPLYCSWSPGLIKSVCSLGFTQVTKCSIILCACVCQLLFVIIIIYFLANSNLADALAGTPGKSAALKYIEHIPVQNSGCYLPSISLPFSSVLYQLQSFLWILLYISVKRPG